MNIFILDTDIEACARYHCDKHVVKMILESAQMLSTAVNLTGGEAPYRSTHKNHPCSIWARESLSNWRWLRDLTLALNEEYKYRYNSTNDHKSAAIVKGLAEPDIPDIGLTPFAQAMPDEYKNDDAVTAYRNYYMGDKRDIATWHGKVVYLEDETPTYPYARTKPEWYI